MNRACVLVLCAACYEYEPPPPATIAPEMTPDPIGEDEPIAPPPPPDAEAFFYGRIAPMIAGSDGRSGSCGPCHSTHGGIGPGFLEADPDLLSAMLAYPYLIGDTPETSRLYTKGPHHASPGLSEAQALIVAEWIVLYNGARETPPARPRIEPFQPLEGANLIDLSVLDAQLAGQTISFLAAGSTTASLVISELTIHAAPNAGVHLVHPLWAQWSSDDRPLPDRSDAFFGVDQLVPRGERAPLGAGLFIFPAYAGERINLAFEKIEAVE